MINIAFRLLLTLNATSLLLVVYLVQKGVTLGKLFYLVEWLSMMPSMMSYVIYLLVPVALTKISLLLSPRLGKDEFKKGSVESIEHANNSFLPSYLGYFFVALSVGSWEALWFVYCVLFVFTFLSQALYFNPLFLLFGYDFYNIRTRGGASVFLISKGGYRKPDEVDISSASRINNYTFIERG